MSLVDEPKRDILPAAFLASKTFAKDAEIVIGAIHHFEIFRSELHRPLAFQGAAEDPEVIVPLFQFFDRKHSKPIAFRSKGTSMGFPLNRIKM